MTTIQTDFDAADVIHRVIDLRGRALEEAKSHTKWLAARGVQLTDTPHGTKWELALGVDADKPPFAVLA